MRCCGVLVLVLWGCFSPTANQNIPCGANLDCPNGQSCDTNQSPPVCTSHPSEDIDAPLGVDTPIDLPIVACTTSADCTDPAVPFCDLGTNTCRPCQADSECGSHVCIESAGTCLDAAEALFVSVINGTDAGNCQTEAAPCKSISFALGKLDNARRTIRVANGTTYAESFVFDTVGKVTLSGEGTTFGNTTITHAITGFGTGAHDHMVEMTGANDILIEGMTLMGGTAESVRVLTNNKLQLFAVRLSGAKGGIDMTGAAAQVTVRQSKIDNQTDSGGSSGNGSGISVANGASITVARTVIDSNAQGIRMQSTAAQINYAIVNCQITRNTGTGVTIPMAVGATHLFDFNTVANNGGAPSVNCVSIQNLGSSIFADDDVGTCTASYSLFTGTALGGGTNIGNATPMFVAVDNFHLMAGSPAIDKADPGANATQDIDGEARPANNKYDIGMDEYH